MSEASNAPAITECCPLYSPAALYATVHLPLPAVDGQIHAAFGIKHHPFLF